MVDVNGTAAWLCELISERVASDENLSDVPLFLDDGKFAIVSLEDASVYLVTVQEARFAVASEPKEQK
jgi:hypothetical protein